MARPNDPHFVSVALLVASLSVGAALVGAWIGIFVALMRAAS